MGSGSKSLTTVKQCKLNNKKRLSNVWFIFRYLGKEWFVKLHFKGFNSVLSFKLQLFYDNGLHVQSEFKTINKAITRNLVE